MTHKYLYKKFNEALIMLYANFFFFFVLFLDYCCWVIFVDLLLKSHSHIKKKVFREICLLFIDKNNIIALTMDEWNLFSLFPWFSNEFLCTGHVLQWFCVKNIALVMNMIEKIKSKVMRKFVFNTETLKLWFFSFYDFS